MSRTDNVGTMSGKDVIIDIDDTQDYDASAASTTLVLKELIGAEDVAHLGTVSDSDDIGKQIIGKHIRAKFRSTSEINGSTFSQGEDGRFPATMYYNGALGPVTVLKGFLLQDDIQDAYLPPGSDVELTITDGLGLLRDVELTDFNGEKLKGTYSKIQLIAFALAKTGLKLYINVADNLYESRNRNRVDGINNCPYDQIFFDSFSFMKDSTNFLDCYTILELLLPRYTRLFQRNGEWWIQRLFEHRLIGWKYTRYNWDATKINGAPVPNLKKIIGHQNSVPNGYFINNTTAVVSRRMRKSVTVKSSYAPPPELLRNYHLTRGDERTDITSIDPNEQLFQHEDWVRIYGLGSYSFPPTRLSYITRKNINGYEVERFLRIENDGTNTPWQGVENEHPIFICEKGKLEFSVDFRLYTELPGTEGEMVHAIIIRLEGTDGTKWFMDKEGRWIQTDNNWFTNFNYVNHSWDILYNKGLQYETISVEGVPAPVGGKAYIILTHFGWFPGQFQRTIEYANLSVNVKPFINGSNSLFDSEKHIISQEKNLSAKEEYDLFAYDAPCRSLRGCMLINSEFGVLLPDYTKTNLWIDMTTFGVLLPGNYPANKKYGELIAWDLWHQNKRNKNKIIFNLQGLDTDYDDHNDLIHIFSMLPADSYTSNRWFVVTAMDQNWKDGSWTGTMYEVHLKDQYTDFEGDYKFEFETKNN